MRLTDTHQNAGHNRPRSKKTPDERERVHERNSLEAEANLFHCVRAEAKGVALVVHVGPRHAEGGGESGRLTGHNGTKRPLAPAILRR